MHLDGFPVELRAVGQAAHTNNDVYVWLPDQKVLSLATSPSTAASRSCSRARSRGFRRRCDRCATSTPRCCRPATARSAEATTYLGLLDDLDGYLAYVQDVAAETYAAGLTPLEAAQKHRDNGYESWAETERFVGNFHRAYAALDGYPEDPTLNVPRVWPDMVAFHGGPIACHA